LGNCGKYPPNQTAASARQSSLHLVAILQGANFFRDMHMAFQIPYVYNDITKLCMQQSQVTQKHDHANYRNIGQGEAQHRKYKGLDDGHAYISSD
jgi:hypothetical protein